MRLGWFATRIPILLLLNALCPGQVRQEKPQALLAFEENRKAIASGEISWSMQDKDGELNFLTRWAKNGDEIFEHRGDHEGWTSFNQQSGKGVSKSPLVLMNNTDGLFRVTDDRGLACDWFKRDGSWEFRTIKQESAPRWIHHFKDIRCVGIAPGPYSLEREGGFSELWRYFKGLEFIGWEERRESDLVIVTAHYSDDARVTWYIDPRKGWNAQRVVASAPPNLVEEVQCALQEFDGVWLPAVAQYFVNGEPVRTVTIRGASLGHSAEAARFTLNDLGMEPGANVSLKNAERGIQRWNGSGITSADEWYADVKSGKRAFGPTFERLSRGEEVHSPYEQSPEWREQLRLIKQQNHFQAEVGTYNRLWVKYVRDFIARHALNGEQTQKAELILNECQAAAEAHVRQKHKEYSEAVAELEQAEEEKSAERIAAARSRLQQLNKPIEQIFERQLKPRLDKLPTREQRQRAATQPSAAPGDGN